MEEHQIQAISQPKQINNDIMKISRSLYYFTINMLVSRKNKNARGILHFYNVYSKIIKKIKLIIYNFEKKRIREGNQKKNES